MKNLTVNNSTKMLRQFIGSAEAEITISSMDGDLAEGVVIAKYNNTTAEYTIKDRSVVGVNAVLPSVEEVAPSVEEVLTTKLVIKKSANVVASNKTNYVMQIVVSSNIANTKKKISDTYDITRIFNTDKFLVSKHGQVEPFMYDVTFEDARKSIMNTHSLVYVSKVPRKLASVDGLRIAMLGHTLGFLNSMGFNVENLTLSQSSKLMIGIMDLATETLGEATLGVLEQK